MSFRMRALSSFLRFLRSDLYDFSIQRRSSRDSALSSSLYKKTRDGDGKDSVFGGLIVFSTQIFSITNLDVVVVAKLAPGLGRVPEVIKGLDRFVGCILITQRRHRLLDKPAVEILLSEVSE